jgi:hypothetical protein
MASFNRQLLNAVQYDFLALSSNISAGVDMDGFTSVAFLVNFSGASGNATMTLEQSADNGNWTAVAPAYLTNATALYPTSGLTSVVANAAQSANKTLAIEFNRLGRETSVPAVTATPSSVRYLRVNVTSGTPNFAFALKSNPQWEPVTQPDLLTTSVKASN